MFTGIIEEVGKVEEATERSAPHPSARHILEDTKLGDSIAINGVDLTVAEMDGGSFKANVMPETYRRSNLGELKPGDCGESRALRAANGPTQRAHRPRRRRGHRNGPVCWSPKATR